ncbi:urease accessory protein UreD [Halalkalibacterium halodurans]|uniref:urease accessory protein UreD n=1 Tax=Halalkalibacterium halodurans TaxID=86665 RepID=UPI002AA97EB4|nr:urease accessory protein UreD [Halalkalibacterium halodurans]MDY7220771.1 urease accessory protein UreD [Halalkalibacterium halodurans]MDY7240010.1 urease accessory protein UreD [Halalkalibacterium halodurans]
MRASSHLPQLHGRLDLTFERRRGTTRLVASEQTPPLNVSRVLRTEEVDLATVYLVETSGGVVSGDSQTIAIYVGEGARVELIPQSATKVYPSRKQGESSTQQVWLRVNEGAAAFWKPESIIPFRKASFLQSTRFHLHSSSTFFYGDMLTPGRVHHNERFQYEQVDSLVEIYLDETLVVHDRVHLQPKDQLQTIGRLDGYSYYGAVWMHAPILKGAHLEQWMENGGQNDRFAYTCVAEGLIHVRWLSESSWRLRAALNDLYTAFRTFALKGE